MRRIASLVVVALLAVACSESDVAAPETDEVGATVATVAPDATTTTTLRPPPPTDPPERAEPTIGDLVIPCRPVESVALPERPGVAPDSVTIGTGSDRGGSGTPGAGEGIIEMVEVLVDLCNANGGIAGRDLRVVDYDAAGAEAVERVEEACGEAVALVGVLFLQRIETLLTAAGCGLPLFAAGTGLVPTTPFALHAHLVAFFNDPENAAAIVLVGPDTPLAALARAERRRAIEAGGGALAVVGEIAYPIDAVPDWGRIAGQARALGAGQVHLDGSCGQAVLPFTEVAERAGWRPFVIGSAAAYDDACRSTPQPDRLLIEIPFLPFEDGAAAPATAAHAALLDGIGAPRTGAGLLAATEFWRWASAAEQCLADFDPECWTSARAAQGDWTAGGLHPALDADGRSEGCAVVLGVENGEFVRRLPADPGVYDCTPELSVLLPAAG